MSQLFIIDKDKARPADVATLPDANLQERKHLQEWVIANPTILGEDVMVVTSEYANWAAETGGAPAYDRLDVLGMDSLGRLIVVELKRSVATRDIHLQAITYAALVSRFTVETLAQAHAAFLNRKEDTSITEGEARTRLLDHVGDDLDPDLLKRPRQVLIASSFPKQVTSSVVWLSEMGLDISLVQVSLWRVGEELVADFSTVYPTQEVEEFTLAPKRGEAGEVSKRIEQRTRSKNVVQFLVELGLLPAGTELRVVPTHGIAAETREEVGAWLDQDSTRRVAVWTGEAPKAICWQGEHYTPTGLANVALEKATGTTAAIKGPAWFVLSDSRCPEDAGPEQWAEFQGKTLADIARMLGLGSAGGRRAPIIDRLLSADAPAEGQALAIVVPPIKQDVDGIRTWLASDPKRATATWHQDPDAQVVWAYDGQAWDMKELAQEILRQSIAVDTDKIWGPNWFQLADGRTLSKIADTLQ